MIARDERAAAQLEADVQAGGVEVVGLPQAPRFVAGRMARPAPKAPPPRPA